MPSNDSISNNPYVLSPSNHKYNESIISAKHALTSIGQYQSLSLTNQNPNQQYSQPLIGPGMLIGAGAGGIALIRKTSFKEGSTTRKGTQATSGIHGNFGQPMAVAPASKSTRESNHIGGKQKYLVSEYASNVTDRELPKAAASDVKQHSKTQRIHVSKI